jgi:hypothetical protein
VGTVARCVSGVADGAGSSASTVGMFGNAPQLYLDRV